MASDRPPLPPFPAEPAPGSWWLHPKKGNVYLVEELSYDSETLEVSVRYRNADGVPFNRPQRMWQETDPETGRPRFVPLDPEQVPDVAAKVGRQVRIGASCIIPPEDPQSLAIPKLVAASRGVCEALAGALVERVRVMRGKLTLVIHAHVVPTDERPSPVIRPRG
jgi:hypothetical protein